MSLASWLTKVKGLRCSTVSMHLSQVLVARRFYAREFSPRRLQPHTGPGHGLADVAHAAMPEEIVEIIAPKPVDLRAAVIEHQDEIREFLDSLADVDEKKKQSIRPYLVAFVKFQASRGLRKAA